MSSVVIGLFFLGSCLGSFLNVVILRSVAALTQSSELPHTFGGRSHCPHCQKQLRWWELVPIISFIFLRGRCAHCRHRISPQYPVVELVMGLLVLFLVTPLPTTLLEAVGVALHIFIAALLVVLFVIDLKTMLLPDNFVAALLVTVIVERIVSQYLSANTADPLLSSEQPLLNILGGAAIGAGFLLVLWLATRGRGIGLGDVKLMVPLGLLFGPLATTTLLFIAYMIGGVIAIYLLLQKKATMKTALPFGPFLCGAALLLLVVPSVPLYLVTLVFGYNPWG